MKDFISMFTYLFIRIAEKIDSKQSQSLDYYIIVSIFRFFTVQVLVEKMDNQHREIIMMFSRIMESLNKNNSIVDTPTSPLDDFSFSDFPCSSLEKLRRINTSCSKSATAMNILV